MNKPCIVLNAHQHECSWSSKYFCDSAGIKWFLVDHFHQNLSFWGLAGLWFLEGTLNSWDYDTQTPCQDDFQCLMVAHANMKIHVHHSSTETAVFHNFSCKHERKQMPAALFLFICRHSCFHNEIRLQQVAFPAAAPSKKSIFLNQKFCNNRQLLLAIIPDSSVCFIHTAGIYGCFSG